MINAIIDRLKAQAPSLTAVSGAEDLEAISRGTAARNGATFVVPFGDDASANTMLSGGFSQRIECRVLIAFVIRRHDDAKGAKRASGFDQFKSEIETAMAGWSISEDNDPFELVSARAASLGNGATIYVQTWQTSRYLRTGP